jgi:hypothetical protein
MASVPQPIAQFERRLPTRVSGSFLQENGRRKEPLPEDILNFIVGRQCGLRHMGILVSVLVSVGFCLWCDLMRRRAMRQTPKAA